MIDLDTAEMSVLGSVLLSHGKVLDELDFMPGDYRHPAHEFIHHTMQEMKNAGKPIDPLTVMDALMKTGEKVDITILHRAVDATPTAANAEYYAAIVSDAAALRRLNQPSSRCLGTALTGRAGCAMTPRRPLPRPGTTTKPSTPGSGAG